MEGVKMSLRSLIRAVTFSTLWSKLFFKKETKVLILGLDNAGKVCPPTITTSIPALPNIEILAIPESLYPQLILPGL